jgi:hypothetical protein
MIMKLLITLTVMLVAATPGMAQVVTEKPAANRPKVETSYDSARDETTLRMSPMQISGNKGPYHSLHVTLAQRFPGRVPRTPETIDFELQTVLRARKLKIDLYVLFVIEGEKSFLTSNRWSVKRPVPGRPWVGERLVFRMPYSTLIKLGHAKQALIRMDGIDFELSDDHLRSFRAFAETIGRTAYNPARIQPVATARGSDKNNWALHTSRSLPLAVLTMNCRLTSSLLRQMSEY